MPNHFNYPSIPCVALGLLAGDLVAQPWIGELHAAIADRLLASPEHAGERLQLGFAAARPAIRQRGTATAAKNSRDLLRASTWPGFLTPPVLTLAASS